MAFRIAVSGLKAATADLDVTGNNIANSNTTGFKQSRAQFADIFAVSNLGTTSDAIGQGVQLTKIAQQFTQGSVSFTDNSLDLAINGPGFFTLDDNGTQSFTRAGAFGVDNNGFVTNASGKKLVAFGAVNGVVNGALAPLQVSAANLSPNASTAVGVGVNLDSSAAVPTGGAFNSADPATFNNSSSVTTFDSLGSQHTATFYFIKTSPGNWNSHMLIDGVDAAPAGVGLSFDANGQLTTGMPVTYGPPFALTNGANPLALSIDYTGSTQVGANFGVNKLTQDGFTTGQLSGIDIDKTGLVLARFSNGRSQAQGQVALANFADPQGLKPDSESTWVESSASGPPLIGAPGSSSLGLLQAGALEKSNVNISEQLVNMIEAQRNFQANAQVIQTEDQVTQAVMNIR